MAQASRAAALLPPILLYRRLMHAHRRHLSPAMRTLGDEYIKREFRAHRSVDSPVHIVAFLSEWQLYAQKIEGDSWADDKLDPSKLDKMSDEQLGQLHELMQATQGYGSDGEPRSPRPGKKPT